MGTSRAGITDSAETVRRACDRCHERKVKVSRIGRCKADMRLIGSVMVNIRVRDAAGRRRTVALINQYYRKGQRRGRPRCYSVIPVLADDRREKRIDENARYHPYRAGPSTAPVTASPAVLQSLDEFVDVGDIQTADLEWDHSLLDPFADWTAFLASRPSSRPGSRPTSRPTSRPGSRNVSRPSTPVQGKSQWMVVRSRPPTPPSLAIPEYVQHDLTSTPFGLSVPLFNLPFTPPEDISPILTLTLETLVKPQLDVFFVRIFPMMPVFPPSYTFSRLSDPNAIRCPDFVAMILSMSALSLIHPLMSHEMVEKVARAKKAKVFLDEACRLMARWDHGSNVTLEAVMAKYLMFGTLFELGHAGPAGLRLKEAVHLGAEMCLDRVESYHGLEPLERKRRMRMYWVLAVTER
jgi:hypothetical protein